MAKYDEAPIAAINGKAYRDYLAKHPTQEKITLTRGQLEAICRDLIDYTDRDADARLFAEQATKNAATIARMRPVVDAALRDREHFPACEDCNDEVCNIGAEYVCRLAEAVDAYADAEQQGLIETGMAVVRRILADQKPSGAK